MFFDIDSHKPIDEFALSKSISFVLSKLIAIKFNPKIHRCNAVSYENDKV